MHLHGNRVGDDGAAALGEALKSNSALRTLELHGNRVGADSAAALGGALKSNSALQALNQHMRARAVAARLYLVRRVPGHHRGDDRADAALRSITAQPALAEALGATRGRFRRQLADTGTMEQRARAVRVVRRHNALELPLAQLPGHRPSMTRRSRTRTRTRSTP